MTAETNGSSGQSLHPLAQLYARWALNPLVEIAHGLAHDVAVRPENYRHLSRSTIETLNNFRFKLGTDPHWPNAFQRTLSFRPLYRVSERGHARRGVAGAS